MARLQSRIDRIRRELKPKAIAGSVSRNDLNAAASQVPTIVLMALSDDDHRLTQQLKFLRDLIHVHPAPPKSSDPPRGKGKKRGKSVPAEGPMVLAPHNLFTPTPGISEAQLRQVWPVQLLLMITARSGQRHELIQYLNLSELEITQAAQAGYGFTVANWTTPEAACRLLEALDWLDEIDSPKPFTLDGQRFCKDGVEVKLRGQQLAFVRLLLDNLDKSVSRTQFANVGIKDPVNIKHKLLRKLSSHDIDLNISERDSGYTLCSD